MPALLVSLDGNADIFFDQLVIVVGRYRGCSVRIASSRVSRRHCCLALDRDGVLVRDLGSTNGTRINRQRIEEGLLRPGDELSIAHFRYRLEGLSST
jgi:pSer/pThr/pTyr-binding forkhead associated (FHA) protein